MKAGAVWTKQSSVNKSTWDYMARAAFTPLAVPSQGRGFCTHSALSQSSRRAMYLQKKRSPTAPSGSGRPTWATPKPWATSLPKRLPQEVLVLR